MAPIRAFVAIELPTNIKEELAKIQAALKVPGVMARWVDPNSIHLTLKFLGGIRQEQLSPIKEALSAAAGYSAPFSISLARPGVFPSLARPRVLWVGVEDRSGALQGLQRHIEEGLKGLGFEPEEREYSPHLTLARINEVRGKGDLQRAVNSIVMSAMEPMPVNHFNLMQSDLKPSGAVYTVLESFGLRH